MGALKNKRHRVIVRAWGDELVVLFVHSIDNKTVYVGQDNGMRSIGLPLSDIFAFDEKTFSALSTAYKNREVEALADIFDNLEDFSCNKYQDNLESLHETEPIADSCSPTDRGEQ